ncbi:MAG: CCA tRNA nucleotidyltransferase [Bacillota bacterium]
MDRLQKLSDIVAQLEIQCFVVGGAVRDYLLQTELKDIDLVMQKDVEQVARKFADQLSGSFVELDAERKIYRVVDDGFNYDFAPLTNNSIKSDLLRREFTINALGCGLDVFKLQNRDEILANLIDPTGGLEDLKQGVIRAVSSDVFSADPLRVLRAVRFRAELDFEITTPTEELIQESVSKIDKVARERIQVELMKLLATTKAAENVEYLEEQFLLLSVLIPEVDKMKKAGRCKYHQEDLWTHSLFTLKQLENLLTKEFWQQEIEEDMLSALKLAALFHDIGKLETETKVNGEIHFYNHHQVGANYITPVLRKLSLSRQQISYIRTLIRYHMRPLFLYNANNLTIKGKYRFFLAVDDLVGDVVVLAAADMLATCILNDQITEIDDTLTFFQQLLREVKELAKRTAEDLIDGSTVMEELGIEEGKKVGRVLKAVKEAQAEGLVNSHQEAIEYIKSKFVSQESTT